jgi:tetratricopeptide (TPR) repeat protein
LAAAHYNLALTEARLKNIERSNREILCLRRNTTGTTRTLSIISVSSIRCAHTGNDKDLSEAAFKNILKQNEKLIDVRLSLGLLYESWEKRDQALEQYRKILDFLPDDGNEMIRSTREQVQKLISTLQSGRSNIAPNSSAADIVQPTTLSPALPVSQLPVEPNASPLTGINSRESLDF